MVKHWKNRQISMRIQKVNPVVATCCNRLCWMNRIRFDEFEGRETSVKSQDLDWWFTRLRNIRLAKHVAPPHPQSVLVDKAPAAGHYRESAEAESPI